jgi:hypothetical protein
LGRPKKDTRCHFAGQTGKISTSVYCIRLPQKKTDDRKCKIGHSHNSWQQNNRAIRNNKNNNKSTLKQILLQQQEHCKVPDKCAPITIIFVIHF